MRDDLTYLGILLDRSGSMTSIKEATISGVNKVLQEQTQLEGNCIVSLWQFDKRNRLNTIFKNQEILSLDLDSDLVTTFENVNIKNVNLLTNEAYQPYGETPYYDCATLAIEKAGKYLASLSESERPSKVVFVIITDGLENASVKITKQQLRDAIKHQVEVYNWQINFIGADINAEEVAIGSGILSSHSLQWAKNREGTEKAYASFSRNVRAYRSGVREDTSFTMEDRLEQEEAKDKGINDKSF